MRRFLRARPAELAGSSASWIRAARACPYATHEKVRDYMILPGNRIETGKHGPIPKNGLRIRRFGIRATSFSELS